jgi:heme/copper-type cytochrome/quinol oxidase subunit 3
MGDPSGAHQYDGRRIQYLRAAHIEPLGSAGPQSRVGGRRQEAAKLLGATIFGGAVFLTVKAFEWAHEISIGYTITSNTFWSFYYTAAGLHALHVIAGMIIMGIVAKDAYKGLELHRVELIGIYWHFVDLVWIFLFPLLYIAK